MATTIVSPMIYYFISSIFKPLWASWCCLGVAKPSLVLAITPALIHSGCRPWSIRSSLHSHSLSECSVLTTLEAAEEIPVIIGFGVHGVHAGPNYDIVTYDIVVL